MPKVHELSICQALLMQVTDIAEKNRATVVAKITIEVGPLAGVDSAQLATAFLSLRAGSCAAHAELVIESPVVILRCVSCGAQSQALPNRLVCGACGGFRVRIMAGEELRLRRVELEVPISQPACAA